MMKNISHLNKSKRKVHVEFDDQIIKKLLARPFRVPIPGYTGIYYLNLMMVLEVWGI